MAAVDYARLRDGARPRAGCCSSRTARRSSSRAARRSGTRCATPRSARSGSADERPTRFEHVFASIQSLHSAGLRQHRPGAFRRRHRRRVPSRRRAVVRGAARAPEARRAARPDRDAGARGRPRRPPLLRRPDRRRAAALGRDRPAVPRAVRLLRRPRRARPARRPVAARPGLRRRRARRTSSPPTTSGRDSSSSRSGGRSPTRRAMRALGFCVSVDHARFMAERFTEPVCLRSRSGATAAAEERRAALRDLADGDDPRRLHGRSLQRGRRRPERRHAAAAAPDREPDALPPAARARPAEGDGKTVCTVLDFVGTHRKEFRFDRRFRALLGGSRATSSARSSRTSRSCRPAATRARPGRAGDRARSIRDAIPSTWRERCAELRSLGDIGSASYLERPVSNSRTSTPAATAGRRCAARRASTSPCRPGGDCASSGPSVGSCTSTTTNGSTLIRGFSRATRRRRWKRCRCASSGSSGCWSASLTTLSCAPRDVEDAIAQLWAHPQVRAELIEVLGLLRERVPYPGPSARAASSARSRFTRATRARRSSPPSASARRQAADVADGRLVGAGVARPTSSRSLSTRAWAGSRRRRGIATMRSALS